MNKPLALALVVAANLALAQEVGQYNRGLSAFNAGDYDAASQLFYELAETSTEPEMRAKSEYYLGQSLHKKGLPVAASVYFSTILKAGKAHPFYLKAVEQLVTIQAQLNDQFLIPSLLNREYSDEWATLPAESLARINFLIGLIGNRQARFEEAQQFLESIPKESVMYAKAQYLLGLVLVDPRFPGGPKVENAVGAFEEVLTLSGPRYEELTNTQQLALLALGRAHYGAGNFELSSQAYERVPRFSQYWDQALFENGFSRFQKDDYGGALGSLQALHAPQFAGAFQPESWILKATIYYFSCLYEESKAALKAFDELYLPMAEALRPSLEGEDRDFNFFYTLLTERPDSLPRPVYLWVRNNQRLVGLFAMLEGIDKERALIEGTQAWRRSKIGPDLLNLLEVNRNTLTMTAGQATRLRLQEALQTIKKFSDDAEIIRFETSKAEKELFEAGVDQQKILNAKRLYRPAMPAEDWNYWRFQGEFWIDEIGYYQYTLKKACPANR
jgi:hypothetical protein